MALRPLSRARDFAFPDTAWDVRGWTVRTEVGDDKVGRVEDMLLDGSGRLRYLDVDLGFLKKHVLVPLDSAHADRERETVRIEGMSKERMEAVPEYALDPETLDEDYQRRLDAVYGRASLPARDAAGHRAMNPDGPLDLQRMGVLEDEYRVAGDDPRGWAVLTGDGRRVGKVAELLMEPGVMKARYLDVAVDEKTLELEPVDRHILVPTERVRLDRGKKTVVVSGLLAGDVARYPQYGGLPVTHGAARILEDLFGRVETGAPEVGPPPSGTARRQWEDETLSHFYGPRTRARMHVEERHG